MKKILIVSVCMMLLLLSTSTIQSKEFDNTEETESTGIFDRTLVMGLVVNTVQKDQTITATAVYLFYMSPGILISDAGIIYGKEVSMMDSPFLFLYEPGPFDMVTYVLGFARDFSVVE